MLFGTTTIMLKKICSYHGCRALVDYTDKYCDKHKDIADIENKERYKLYKNNRTDKKEQLLYNSKEWIQLRQVVLNHYKGLDIYEYYINNRIQYAEIVHHIVEVKDSWNKRLVFSNMFPCTKATHNLIHSLYDKDKKGTQQLLYDLINKYNKEFNK